MENFRIYFQEGEAEEVLRILQNCSDVIIDNVQSNSIGITIERDNADWYYVRLLDRIDRQVFDFRPHHRYF
jgi:hypothetical protein